MRNAFSLMELMVVIIILGLLAAVVLPSLTGKSEEAKRKLTCVQLKSISNALKMFKVDNGRYPSTEEGLKSLIANPDPDNLITYARSGYLEEKKIPKDPWSNDYLYVFNEDVGFEIVSFASDKKEGGKNDNEDIYYSKCP